MNGEPLSIPRRQVRALLYRLAAEPRPLSRSYVGYLFWADCPENTARQNLSRLLVYLSRALPAGGLIQVDESQIQLAPGRVAVDTCAFERYWEGWKTSHQIQGLHAAVELYRGPFLDGFYLPGSAEYNTWIQEQAECWELRYLKSLDLLIEGMSASGNLSLAIEYANRYLAYNNLAEDIHRKLIDLHAACGDRSAALRQYEVCVTMLERELGVRPAPETVEAYRSAMEHRYPGVHISAPSVSWTILPSLQAPLIGRQGIMDALEGAHTQTRDGNGQVVFICGEPGIGKSRLVQEFASRPRLRTRLLIGSATHECCTIPYQPLVEAMRPAVRTPSLLQSLPPIWVAEASRLFPELAGITSKFTAPFSLSADEARFRLFEALFHILLGLTEGGYSVILCVDDLQWADATTLNWLAYAGQRISNQRVLVVGTYRHGEDENLVDLRGSLARQANFGELSLSGLTCNDVIRLCENLREAWVLDKRQAERLCQTTGGNPFFLLETIREMLETGSQLGDAIPLPATVQAAVASRLERLRPQVRQVLEAASVLGLDFSFELVHHTSGRQEMEILDGLDDLVARQFLVEVASGYQFCHAIIREAVYAGLSHWRRRKLHERAGRILEKLNSNDWSGIAWHFEKAGEPGKAARYALRAGQAAKAVFAHVEARVDFDCALALLEQEAKEHLDAEALEANRRTRIELLYERGWALRLIGDMEAYTRDLEQVADLAQLLGDEHALARLRWQEAYNHRWFCRYAAAQSAAHEGLRLCQQVVDPHLEAQCLRELGMSARESGDYALAQSTLEKALEFFKGQTDDPVHTMHTLGNLSTLYCRQGETTQALDLARQALELCERSQLPYERRLPLGDIGAALAAQGDFDDSRTCLLESLAIAREIADRTQEIYCQGHLGWVELYRGNFAAGHQLLEDALLLAEQISSLSEQSWLHAGLAQAHAGLGELDAALVHADQALCIAQSYGRQADLEAAEQLLATYSL